MAAAVRTYTDDVTDDSSRLHGAPPRLVVLSAALVWVIGVYVVQQFIIGGRLVTVPLLILGPLAASMVLEWRDTAIAAAVTVAAVSLLSYDTGDVGTVQGALRIIGTVAGATVTVLNARVRVRREQKVRTLAEIAAVAQAAILHPVPARVGDLVLASRYWSASADALVGGDLYDVVSVGDTVRIIVGDVRGKGLPAVHIAAVVLSAFRHAAPVPGRSLEQLAIALEAAVLPSLAAEDFVTVVLCDISPDGRLDVVACGHPAPLLLQPDSLAVEVDVHPCAPLGVGVVPRVRSIQLPPSWRLLLHTDGLLEARNAAGDFLDVPAVLGSSGGDSGDPDEVLDKLLAAVRAHAGGDLQDDLAVLLVAPLATGVVVTPAARTGR